MDVNPLNISEIRLNITYYLDCKSLYASLFVCKSWRDSNLPSLYYKLSICDRRTKPLVESLKNYAEFVRKVNFFGDAGLRYYSVEFNHLTFLSLDNDSYGTEIIPAYVNLILRNKESLREFEIARHTVVPTAEIWEALLQCSRLNSLSLSQYSIRNEDTELFWQACSNVKRLTLNLLTIIYPNISGTLLDPDLTQEFVELPREIPKLTSLILLRPRGFSYHSQLQLISKTKNLLKLQWNPKDPGNSDSLGSHWNIEEYQTFLSSGVLKNVQDINITNVPIDDEVTALTLREIDEVFSLVMSNVEFLEGSCLSLLNHHATTVRYLNICGCKPPSSIVQEILSSCHSLEVFIAFSINGEELVQYPGGISDKEGMDPENLSVGKDWVCLGLRKLVVFFDMGPKNWSYGRNHEIMEHCRQQRQFHAFRQLSRLTELEELSVSRNHGHGCLLSDQGSDLKIEFMSALASLKKLEMFYFNNMDQKMTEDEINWISDNWPRLKILHGTFNTDESKHKVLKNYLAVLKRTSSLIIYD